VYYDISSFPAYGRLSGNTVEGLDPGARIGIRSEKKHPADFALWIHNPKHLMQWQAPWGAGYPGWHIECSAMSMKYLGETVDIHTGGEDNKFPHHECEIAQSEGATGKPFVRYWLHVTHLLVDGEKMSKSKGNFFVLDDLVKKGYEPRVVRYLLLSSHYRQTLNFTFAGLDSAKGALSRFDAFADALAGYRAESAGRPSTAAKKAIGQVGKALDDDLNAPEALAAAFEFVRLANEKIAARTLTERERLAAIEFLRGLGDLLGFTFGRAEAEQAVPPSILALIEKRDEARRERRFAEADRIRDEIKEKGYVIEDTPEGRRIRKV
jgi:cysteinyl-tRNA synthetase